MRDRTLPLDSTTTAAGSAGWNLARPLSALTLLLTGALLASAVVAYVRTGDGIGGDFLTDFAGGYLVRTGDGDSLYDIEMQERVQKELSPAGADDDVNPFVLPPAAAWLFAPMSAMPYRSAHILFTAINLAALAGVLWLFNDELREAPGKLRAAFLVAFALSMPAITDISWGQIDLLLVAAALLGWRFMRTGHDVLAGCALGLAVLKPHFLIGIVLLLLVQRRWVTLLPLAGIGFAVLVPPSLALGLGALGDYLSLVLGRTQLPEHIDAQPQHMANWRGLMTSLTGSDEGWVWIPGAVLVGVAALTVCIREWVRDAGSPRSYAIACALPLLLSPHVHMQSMMLLFVAIAIMLQAGVRSVSLPGRRQLDAASALLVLQALLFAGWFLTANDLALMVVITGAVFVWTAFAPVPVSEPVAEELPLAA
jgi:hypothetical protein